VADFASACFGVRFPLPWLISQVHLCLRKLSCVDLYVLP